MQGQEQEQNPAKNKRRHSPVQSLRVWLLGQGSPGGGIAATPLLGRLPCAHSLCARRCVAVWLPCRLRPARGARGRLL